MSFINMSPSSLYEHPFTLLSILTLATLTAYIIYQRHFSPLASIPGPFLASISRAWLTSHSRSGDLHRTMIALHAQYGPLVRTGPNEVSVADLTAIKQIYGAGTKFRKSDWYSVWQGKGASFRKFDLFAERDESIHGKQRGLVSAAYSMAGLRNLEGSVDGCVVKFLQKMGEMVGQEVDMGKWVQLFAFDVIGEVSFSKSFGFMDSEADDGSFGRIESALRSAAWVGQVPWLFRIHHYLTPLFGNRLALNNRHGHIRSFALQSINARLDRGSERNDILSKLLTMQKEKPGSGLDDAALTSMATSNIFAGSDTTAISTRAIIWYLLKNPVEMRRLVAEIDEARSKGELSDVVKLEEAEKMPFLQAVMWEALRLHPAVGMSLPRVVPAGGAIIADKFMPGGMTVGVNPWVIHRNQDVFGEDVEEFRPDRWLQEDTGNLKRFFFAFGAGARMCLGRNISWMEMSKLIPTLVMHYHLELVDEKAEWSETCYWFVMQKGVNVRLSKRNN